MEMKEKRKIVNAEIIENTVNETLNQSSKKLELKVIDENGVINLANLSDDDKQRYERLNKSLVITDINSISNYGSDLQTTMSKYSNDFLTAVRGSNGGEIGDLITDLLGELNYIDVDELRARVKESHNKQTVNSLPENSEVSTKEEEEK